MSNWNAHLILPNKKLMMTSHVNKQNVGGILGPSLYANIKNVLKLIKKNV